MIFLQKLAKIETIFNFFPKSLEKLGIFLDLFWTFFKKFRNFKIVFYFFPKKILIFFIQIIGLLNIFFNLQKLVPCINYDSKSHYLYQKQENSQYRVLIKKVVVWFFEKNVQNSS